MGFWAQQWRDIKGNLKFWVLSWIFGGGMLAAVISAIQKLRHLPLDWIFILGTFSVSVLGLAGVTIVGSLTNRSRAPSSSEKSKHDEPEGNKLVIHYAAYGTSPLDDIPITDKLETAAREALVILVDNSLVPRDPALGKVKRLRVDYSYGNPSIHRVSRLENSGRLVLPEDSEVLRLTGEVEQLTQQLRAARVTTPPTIQQKTENVPQRDWSGDWKELSGRFEPLARSGIRADQQKGRDYERWDITGGDNVAADRIKTLCKHAGGLLSKSPNVSRSIPAAILAISDARERWLSYLKYAKPSSFRSLGHGTEQGRTIYLGSIIDLAIVSANECLECAGKEY